MEIRRSKPLNSDFIKRDLDKRDSIAKAAEFSRGIKKGAKLSGCPICGGAKSGKLAEVYGFIYLECLNCGTAYVCNPPSEADLQAAYLSEYYTAANKVLLANDSIIDYRTKNIAEPKVRFVAEHLTTSQRNWLDVGCGAGENLGVAKSLGFETLGYEANPMEAEYARRKFDLEVKDQYVAATSLAGKADRFGVISLFSVLEHVLNPNELLAAVARLQGQGDNLVLEVPHFPSLSGYSQISFPEHVNRVMHPPLHLFLFPMKSLELMLKKQGYEIRAAWFFGQDIYEVLSTLGLFAPDLSASTLYRTGLAPLINDLQSVVDNHGLSDEMLVVAEKKT